MGILLTTGGPVNFPGLGLTIEHLIKGFDVFGVHISLSGILLALAMFLGLFITERLAKKTEQNTEHYLDLAIRLVIAGVVGARTGFVITHWQYFASDQGNVFNISDGGMSFAGAVIAGLIVSFVYCRQKKLSWLVVCDTALPGVVVGQILGKLGEFFERSALGTYSDGKFAMQVDIQSVDSRVLRLGSASSQMMRGSFLQVHPVALYEAVLLLILVVVLCVLWKKRALNGIMLGAYLIVYSLIRFGLEFIRLDSVKLLGSPVSLEHIVAAVLLIFGVMILIDQIKKYCSIQKERPKNLKISKKN